MNKYLKEIKASYGLNTILNSYSLIFFSVNKLFALSILSVSFFTPIIGLFGLISVILINSIAFIVGFNREDIKSGLFGFNALFLGMVLAQDYSINPSFLILFLFSNLTLLLITVWIKGLLGNYQLPFLSIPFVVTYWIVQLAASNLSNIHLNESGVYIYNELAINQQSIMHQLVHSLDEIPFPKLVSTFFKTLGGVFFQSSIMAGIIIAFGLLMASRISFSLAVIGFILAYFFYNLFGANVNDLK